jgi:hypothetical protein
MPSDAPWQTIQNDLNQLLADQTLAPLHPSLEKLQHWLSANAFSPEIFSELIAMFQRMGAELQAGKPADELVNAAAAGQFAQPGWQVQTVYQAQGNIFQILMDPARQKVSEPDPGITVPIVLLVMTADEAQALDSGVAFQGYPEEVRADFDELRTLLIKNNMPNWAQNYGARAEEWQPFKESADTIEQLARLVLSKVEGYRKPLTPQFINIQGITEDRSRLRRLRRDGCVVIMDTVSMHHPDIQREYRRSLLDAYSNTLVARIALFDDAFSVIQRMLPFAEQYVDLEVYKRLEVDQDDNCTEVCKASAFSRWLKGKVPEIIPAGEKAQAGIRDFYNK